MLLAAAVLAAGCASAPPPDDTMARAELVIDQAAQAGAGQYAPLQLRNARKDFERARSLVREEDYVSARRAAENALSNAELAEAMARAARAERSADKAENNLERLKREVERAKEFNR